MIIGYSYNKIEIGTVVSGIYDKFGDPNNTCNGMIIGLSNKKEYIKFVKETGGKLKVPFNGKEIFYKISID